jgi:hypothetical protein
MKRAIQVALTCGIVLATASVAAAQQVPPPVVWVGNWAVRLRGAPLEFTGQKADSVLLMCSWSGRLGPVRALVQGNLLVETERGGTAGLPAGVQAGRKYDIFAGGVVTYAEVDFGSVRPFLSFIYGSGDGVPTDNKLHGFSPAPQGDVTQHTAVSWFAHLDTSRAYAGRDYACPARAGRAAGSTRQ